MKYAAFVRKLESDLTPYYTPPNTTVSYDVNHVKEMLALGSKIAALTCFRDVLSLQEYEVAVWLHNTDRPKELNAKINQIADADGTDFKTAWGGYLAGFLKDSPFKEEGKRRIITAIQQHSKKDDEPGDSVLLTALRIADKVVRFGPLGMMGQSANNRGNMFYDRNNPFGYASTEEGKLNSVYNDFMRVLEWYAMLPSDEARSLIKPQYLKLQIAYLRGVGEQIAEYTGIKNGVETDIAKALGKYYRPSA